MTVDLRTCLDKCDGEKVLAFPLRPLTVTASTRKKVATAKIELPRNVIDRDIRDLDRWVVMVIAIDRDEYDKAFGKAE